MSAGGVRIVPGLNLWNVAVRGDTGQSRERVLRNMRSVGWQLLAPFQGSMVQVYHYGAAHTHWAWAIGDARPFEALDATRERPNLSAQGEVLSQFSGNVQSDAWLGPAPLWHVEAWVFWRGPESVSDEWPTAYEPNALTGLPASSLLYPPYATVETAVDARAEHGSQDKSYGETWRERIEREIDITVSDLPDVSPQSNPIPYALAAGAAVVFVGVLASKLGD